MSETLIKAEKFATNAHARIHQLRKYTGQPYQVHLRAVVGLVSAVTSDDNLIAAAWLHDIVEDTPVTFEEIGRAHV